MQNKYWVYVNEPNNKALVHRSSCRFCNDGKGMMDEKLERNGEWHGPYSKEQAESIALKSGKSDIRWCGHCAKVEEIEGNT